MNPDDLRSRFVPLAAVVAAAYREAGQEIPAQMKSMLGRRGASWPWFAAQMFDLDISAGTRKRLKAAFQREDLVEESAGHRPARPTSDEELRAATPLGFNALLRLLHQRSGVSPAVLAKRAGLELPRSQAYEMVRDGRTGLPTKLGQVRAFATACGLSVRQVDALVRVWADLRDTSSTGPSSVLERDLARFLANYRKIVDKHDAMGVGAMKVDVVPAGQVSRGRLLVSEGQRRQRRRL
ncbi:helix-turn-helix domain-containing protein [Lentzea sp. HUAS12]|uniref:helix-turn-helix domain-containing protein n=1 Tax=Lentzea sp. HUAS12 TaxID=2951806 RepID=UPI00209F40A3|nr:helix-turn-helix transcriptional regulator [Lentzea sp. HUAS12]USX49132.1 helix-turn-helix domain-containing protein [Lentzea sp. HUAS12]